MTTATEEKQEEIKTAPAPIKVKAVKRGEYPPGHRRREGAVFYIRGDRHPKGHKRAGEIIDKGKWMIEEHETPLKKEKPNFMKGQAPTSRFHSTEARKHFERTLDDEAREKLMQAEVEKGLNWDGDDLPSGDDFNADPLTGEVTVENDQELGEGFVPKDANPRVKAGDNQDSVYSKPAVTAEPIGASDEVPESKPGKLVKMNRKQLGAMKRQELQSIMAKKEINLPGNLKNEAYIDAILQHQDKEFKNTQVKPEIRRQ